MAQFTSVSGEYLAAGHHHQGIVIALSSRFLRRPPGIGPIVSAISAIADQPFDDRVIYLERAG
jgi:hypothetical protein